MFFSHHNRIFSHHSRLFSHHSRVLSNHSKVFSNHSRIVMFLTRCMLGKLEAGKSLKKVSWPLVYRSFLKISQKSLCNLFRLSHFSDAAHISLKIGCIRLHEWKDLLKKKHSHRWKLESPTRITIACPCQQLLDAGRSLLMRLNRVSST